MINFKNINATWAAIKRNVYTPPQHNTEETIDDRLTELEMRVMELEAQNALLEAKVNPKPPPIKVREPGGRVWYMPPTTPDTHQYH